MALDKNLLHLVCTFCVSLPFWRAPYSLPPTVVPRKSFARMLVCGCHHMPVVLTLTEWTCQAWRVKIKQQGPSSHTTKRETWFQASSSDNAHNLELSLTSESVTSISYLWQCEVPVSAWPSDVLRLAPPGRNHRSCLDFSFYNNQRVPTVPPRPSSCAANQLLGSFAPGKQDSPLGHLVKFMHFFFRKLGK